MLAGRLGGAGSLDSVAEALENPASVADPDRLRRAVAAAVDSVYVGAACAAALALIALLCLAPRRFPVLDQDGEKDPEPGGERSDEGTSGAAGELSWLTRCAPASLTPLTTNRLNSSREPSRKPPTYE